MASFASEPILEPRAAAARLARLFEQLTPERLPELAACYARDAHFKDPFNDVHGVKAITRIFAHMFATVDRPRFVVTGCMVQGAQAFLTWEMHFRLRRWRPDVDQSIQGATLVHFNALGQVERHRDYWDAAEELYEKLPVLGGLMRWLRKAGSATA